MKTTILFLITLLLGQNIVKETSEEREVTIRSSSSLFIKGTSNVNTFICNYNSRQLVETKVVRFQETKNGIKLNGATLKLQNSGFDCGNRGINNDFNELLQTKKYPYIQLDIKEIVTEGDKLTSWVTIEIAGIKKSYYVPVKTNGKAFNYDGLLCVNIKDFNLTPPKKMMGLIVVHEEIEINFNLDLSFRE